MKKIIILVAQFTILLAITFQAAPALAAPCPDGGTYSPTEAVCNPTPNFFVDLVGKVPGGNTFPGITLYIIQQLLKVVGILALAFIIIGGFQYITSAGNEEQAETGKKTLTNAIIGLVIAILSYTIVIVIINALYGNS